MKSGQQKTKEQKKKKKTIGDATSFLFERTMADENVRAIVREELAKVLPKSNHSTLYQHAQSLIRSAAHNSAREISHVNPGINSSSSSTLTAAKESRRNSTSTSDNRNDDNNSNSSSASQRNGQTEQTIGKIWRGKNCSKRKKKNHSGHWRFSGESCS